MPIAFFVSSLGDTDLAKATITKLIEQKSKDSFFLIPLTTTAATRTDDMKGNGLITRVTLDQITKQQDSLTKNKISNQELELILGFAKDKQIQHIYVGVPSSDNEIPFQIANHINLPTTIAYEYMFSPGKHVFWSYVAKLALNENCHFAVPLTAAKEEILKKNKNAKVHEIGHLSIDRSQTPSTFNLKPIRQSLLINSEDELVFVSGTTQPTEVDNQFLNALLSEMSTEKYPRLQLRMGIHPGIKDLDAYLNALLNTCEKFPKAKDKLKIILPTQLEKRLTKPLRDDSFILRGEISGSDAASAADKITQAVPGALLNEAALKGKPVYFHEETEPYLPKPWFSKDIPTFFKGKPTSHHTLQELKLNDTAPNLLSKILANKM